MKTWIAVDTSTAHLSLAIIQDKSIKAQRFVELGRDMSEQLLPEIVDLCQAHDVIWQQSDGWMIGMGPGSFTSLRVGFATLKGLLFHRDVPVVAFSSQHCIADHVASDERPVAVIQDARRDKVFAGLYGTQSSSGFRPVLREPSLVHLQDWWQDIPNEVLVTGDGLRKFSDQICSYVNEDACLDESFWWPRVEASVKRIADAFESGKTQPMANLQPLYLHAADCQVRRS